MVLLAHGLSLLNLFIEVSCQSSLLELSPTSLNDDIDASRLLQSEERGGDYSQMKPKQSASIILAIALAAVVLGSAIAFAPPADIIFPSLVNTFVTNSGPEEAVPVNVTNQLETLDVAVPDGVEITNTQPIDVQVISVLDIQEGTLREADVDFYYGRTILELDTAGYSEITIMFRADENACRYYVKFHIGEEGDRAWFNEDMVDIEDHHFDALTYHIRGPQLEVTVYCREEDGTADATIWYYMTP